MPTDPVTGMRAPTLSLLLFVLGCGGNRHTCNCPLVDDPVCGSDGISYSSACHAGCAGVGIAHAGACTTDGGSDAGPTGLCRTDSDCIFRPDSGCCGLCLATTDPIPPPTPCGAACPIYPPSCLCQNGHCATGTLPQGAACTTARDECSWGLKCCSICSPIPTDGPQCSAPSCQLPAGPPASPYCPQPP